MKVFPNENTNNYNFKLLQITKVFAGQGVHNTVDPGEIPF